MSKPSPQVPRMLVAMIGARRRYAVPRIFEMAYWLERFFTDFYVRSNLAARWARSPFCPDALRVLAGRHADEISPFKVRDFPLFALRRALKSARAVTEPQRLQAFADWNREFGRLVTRLNWKSANAVYVFNAAGLEILERAAREGLLRFVDQVTQPWEIEQAIVEEERSKWPDWEDTAVHRADWAALAERERAEWNLAHVILCGSEAVRDGLVRCGVEARRCKVVRYGIAPDVEPPVRNRSANDPLRVLFVGTLELRKGIPYLLEAACRIPATSAVFRATGPVRLSEKARARLADRIEITGPK